jgi:SH3-like domain-containing protein
MVASLRLGFLLAVIFTAAAAGPAAAQTGGGNTRSDRAEAPAQDIGPSGLPLPRFVTLRAAKVNMRSGPGIRYPIEWVYALKGLPLEVIDEFETWRRIRDWQGSKGWVHQSMLSGQRGVMVVGERRLLRRAPEDDAPGVARIQAGVIGRLHRCAEGWCQIEVKGFDGWLPRDEIYGAYPNEAVE